MHAHTKIAPGFSSRSMMGRMGPCIAALCDYRRVRRDMHHLSELPDYLLSDIGVTRGAVHRIKRNPFGHVTGWT